MTNLQTPVEIDTKLAELYYEMRKTDQRIQRERASVQHMAGAKFYYQGRRRVTDMAYPEAYAILSAEVEEHKGESEYTRLSSSSGYSHGQARDTLSSIKASEDRLHGLERETRELQARYTGWSRFFVVTSSAGHIHSSMHCSTCYPTTSYGWLPELSGKNQEEAIKHFGPAATALCSVCFPDAPVEKMDENLTAKQRDALLRGETPEPEAKKEYCPGSGQAAVNRPSGHRYGACPHCGYVGAVTQYGQMRKHKEKK